MKLRFIAFSLLAIVLVLWGFSSKSYCDVKKCDSQSVVMDANDSYVLDIVNTVCEGQDLDLQSRKTIEDKIKHFPGRVMRRDTVTFFLQTALEMAYYDFVAHDETAMKKSASNFLTNIQEVNPLRLPLRYGLMKFAEATVFDNNPRQKRMCFLNSLISELPLNLDIETYATVFKALKSQGATFSFLDNPVELKFIEKCKGANKTDILNCIADVWEIADINAEEEDINVYFYDDPEEQALHDAAEKEMERMINDLSYQIMDAYGNLDMIDSLIRSNQLDSIGKYMYNFQNLTFHHGELRALIENSKKYEEYVPLPYRMNFYDLWGVAHAWLGEYKEAIGLFNKALEYVNDDVNEAVINMNIALALCESGDIENAISKLKRQEETLSQNDSRFHYLDALAYMVSHVDKEEARKYYEEADRVLEQSMNDPNFRFKYGFDMSLTRHFVREARLYEDDLFKWQGALRQAANYSGINSLFDFFGGIPAGLYYSELGRFRNFLFDREGAYENFEKAYAVLSELDPEDFRARWMNDCIRDIQRYAPSDYSVEEMTAILDSSELSALHNIWLCLNLAYQISLGHNLGAEVLNRYLVENYAEALFALPSYESAYLSAPLKMIQEGLMTPERLEEETEDLSNLNLLRKGLTQSSKGLMEKNLAGFAPEQYKDLAGLRRDLNSAYAYEDSLKVKKLLPAILQKESELYHAYKDSIDLGAFLGTTVNSVRTHLTPEEVAIDFICSQTGDTLRIGAFIIQREKPATFVAIKDIPLSEDGQPAGDLHDIWEPLLPLMNGRENIYFSPDGILLNTGIEFFPAPSGAPIIRDYRVHRVSHLRELKNGENHIDGEIALIGVSDHNSPVGEGETIYRGNWSDMNEVRNEIEDIDSALRGFPHSVYFNDDATESKINDLNGKDISVLHISTHGIYRDFTALSHALADPSHFDHNIAKRTLKTDRRSLCGLVLRGGNIAWKIPHILDEDDDILTDDEIENMSFPDLKLTVLSACGTALGEIDSDGIQGLQRAFKIAGSKNIICSLRDVNDYWTRLFMTLLYQNLADGASVYDAFRDTQRRLYEAEPDKTDLWSSFILIE